MEKLWEYIFIEMDLYKNPIPILLSEEIGNTNEKRGKTIEILFEKFKIPAFSFKETPLLQLYSTGRNSGVILDIGYTKSTACAINQNVCLSTVEISQFGGKEIDEFSKKIFPNATSYKDRKNILLMKERLCKVSLDFDKNQKLNSLPELLFAPNTNDLFDSSIQDLVVNCINSQNNKLTEELCSNIVLAGASSKFKGLPERLKKELSLLIPDQLIDIHSTDNRDISVK